ncbi:MAG: aspartate kinase, partial [Acidobacteriota bacterium]
MQATTSRNPNPGAGSQTRPAPDDPPDWLVLKFGGTSVSSLGRWQTIASTLRSKLERGARPIVVCSALSQVSNRLEALLETAGEGEDVEPGLRDLQSDHEALAADMELDVDELLGETLEDLRQILQGIRLTREVTPRLRARVMSAGEILSTRLGAAWLDGQGIPTTWQDARDMLEGELEPHVPPERQYLSATCDHAPDPGLQERLAALDGKVILTQGFVGRLPNGDTVLLGRGGSDTAAAYLATKVGADHLEIWTDVPGMFTANPHNVPDARLLLHLGYAEAGELASKGAKVLHPRCIRAAQKYAVPIHVRCTPEPDLIGTVISRTGPSETPQVKAVSERRGMVLVSMDVEGDWQGIGVIADITACFKTHGISIDLLASSQTNVTVALDPRANHLDDEVIEPLIADLEELSAPRVIRPTATVSLVGTGIREILHEWAAVLELFEDEEVYMVSQAANDLSLTLLVNDSSADVLVRRIHDRLFTEESPASS